MLTMFAALLLVPATEPPLSLEGVGSFRVGTSVAALRRLGARRAAAPDEPGGCHFWRVPSRPGLSLMVYRNRLVRVDVETGRYRTPAGARIGMTEAEVRRLYGAALRVEPHPYTGPEGHYLVYHRPGAGRGMIFETDYRTGRVVSMRVGYWENVQWIEGCS